MSFEKIPDEIIRNILPFLSTPPFYQDLISFKSTCKRIRGLVASDPNLKNYAPLLSKIEDLHSSHSLIMQEKRKYQALKNEVDTHTRALRAEIKQDLLVLRDQENAMLQQTKSELEKICKDLLTSGYVPSDKKLAALIQDITNFSKNNTKLVMHCGMKNKIAHTMKLFMGGVAAVSSYGIKNSSDQMTQDVAVGIQNFPDAPCWDEWGDWSSDPTCDEAAADYNTQNTMFWIWVTLLIVAVVCIVIASYLNTKFVSNNSDRFGNLKYIDLPVSFLIPQHKNQIKKIRETYQKEFSGKTFVKIADLVAVLQYIYDMNSPSPFGYFSVAKSFIQKIDSLLDSKQVSLSAEILPNTLRSNFFNDINRFVARVSAHKEQQKKPANIMSSNDTLNNSNEDSDADEETSLLADNYRVMEV